MRRNDIKLLIDVVLFVAGTVVFATGMVLLTRFHMGGQVLRPSALGLERGSWLDVHRLAAVAVLATAGIHVALNWKGFVARLRSCFPKHGSTNVPELILYVAFWTCTLTGVAAWLVIGGSPLTVGLISLELHPGRHHVVDVHHVSGILALLLTVHHVGHRWHRMARALKAVRLPGGLT